jgi:hypothetical protein
MGIFSFEGFFHLKFSFMNIVEIIQKNLGFNAVEKIDPNTQETPGPDNPMGNNALAQAGIPAILLGICSALEQHPESDLLDGSRSGSNLERIFGNLTGKIIERITGYSQIADKHRVQELEHIATESLRVLKEKIGEGADEKAIRKFVAANKPDILLYLPPSLDLGTLLQNNNLDDRTGKMEGPVSSLMHRVEKSFNSSAGSS